MYDMFDCGGIERIDLLASDLLLMNFESVTILHIQLKSKLLVSCDATQRRNMAPRERWTCGTALEIRGEGIPYLDYR